MRFVVFLFGLLGCTVTAVLGAIFFMLDQAMAWFHEQNIKELDVFASLDSPMQLAIFLFIAAGLGLLGTMLSLFRCGWQGSLLMLIPLIGPAVINPLTLAGTGPQAFAALLSLFVGPLPLEESGEEDD